jgi:Spy/CpxP family protein refolding chaperone
MKRKLKSGLFCLLTILVASALPVIGAAETRLPGLNLSLTDKQVAALQGVFDEYSSENLELLSEIERKFIDLRLELRRKDRFENRFKAYDSVYKANTLVKEISKLYGETLKTRVKYLLKAKDVLSREQREKLFARLLEFDFDMPDEIFVIVEGDLFSLVIGLKIDQVRKILRYRADMEKKAIDINYKIDMKLIDLQVEMLKDKRDSDKINNIVLTIIDLGTQLMNNRVVHFLKAKDVLTVPQKKALLHIISMM